MRTSQSALRIKLILGKGTKLTTPYARYYHKQDPNHTFCVSISKKVLKNAVDRNRVRRWYKACIPPTQQTGLVVVIRTPPKNYSDVKKCWNVFAEASKK